MTGLWLAVGVLATLILTACGALFLGHAMGRLYLAHDLGRSIHQLGPITATIRAPRELTYEIIAAPYLGRTSAAASGIEVLARFRHLTGPVPHAVEEFVLEEMNGVTELRYSGELGIDFFILGRIAGRHWVRSQWERVVSAHMDDVRQRAETRAARRVARGTESGPDVAG